MQTTISAIKNFCNDIVKQNRQNFNHLNPGNPDNKLTIRQRETFKIFFDQNILFNNFFGSIINKSDYYVMVNKDWKEKMLETYSLSKIRSSLNSQNEKNKLKKIYEKN